MNRRLFILPLFFLSLVNITVTAQEFALKTNLCYGVATLSPNLAVEIAMTPKTTLDLSGAVNLWDLGSNGNFKKMNHYKLSAESRYWINQKFGGHFVGLHVFFINYNVGGINNPFLFFSHLKNNRYEGYGLGTGFSYGYQWYLKANWSVEANLGVGYVYLDYDRFECDKCGDKLGHGTRHYFGSTQIGVSFLYLF